MAIPARSVAFMLFNSLLEKDRFWGLQVHQIQEVLDFAVLDVAGMGLALPYLAPVCRLDCFAFAFIKNGHVKYMMDEQTHFIA